jgi:glutaredoxin
MEVISGKSLGRYNKHPRIISQKLENLNIALNFIQKEGLKLVNVGSDDIYGGNLRIILGLIWTIILRYEIQRGASGDVDAGNAVDDLLKWVQSKIPEYNIKGFTKDWNDGRAVNGLINALRPELCQDHKQLDPNDALGNATKGIDTAFKQMGVDPLVLPAEMIHPKVDKLAMITYIAQYRNLKDTSDAYRIRAYGPGLVEGIVDQPAEFTVEVPSDCTGALDINASNEAGPVALDIKTENGVHKVSYTPKAPGKVNINVTYDDTHVPGSQFNATILASESLGGEGKIRVFYSTTFFRQEDRKNFQSLEILFQAKKIHLRPEFEPFIAIDVLDRPDREAVFRKAGKRTVPMVFVDDQFIGGWTEIAELNEMGQLDRVFKVNEVAHRLLTEDEFHERMKNIPSDPRERAEYLEKQMEELNVDGTDDTSAPAAAAAPAPATTTTTAAGAAPAADAAPAAAPAAGKFCTNCGAALNDGQKFCGSCGTRA